MLNEMAKDIKPQSEMGWFVCGKIACCRRPPLYSAPTSTSDNTKQQCSTQTPSIDLLSSLLSHALQPAIADNESRFCFNPAVPLKSLDI